MHTHWESKGQKYHSRSIDVATYEYDAQRLIVEGRLRDDRFHESYTSTGYRLPDGVIHHMSIRLLVNISNFLIEDIAVDLLTVPLEFCWETSQCLAPIKGLTITKGFTAKVKKLVGGKKGCTHLIELLQAMAPAVFQGVSAYRAPRTPGIDPVRAKASLKYLVNTCSAWREEGPFVEGINKMLNKKQGKDIPGNLDDT